MANVDMVKLDQEQLKQENESSRLQNKFKDKNYSERNSFTNSLRIVWTYAVQLLSIFCAVAGCALLLDIIINNYVLSCVILSCGLLLLELAKRALTAPLFNIKDKFGYYQKSSVAVVVFISIISISSSSVGSYLWTAKYHKPAELISIQDIKDEFNQKKKESLAPFLAAKNAANAKIDSVGKKHQWKGVVTKEGRKIKKPYEQMAAVASDSILTKTSVIMSLRDAAIQEAEAKNKILQQEHNELVTLVCLIVSVIMFFMELSFYYCMRGIEYYDFMRYREQEGLVLGKKTDQNRPKQPVLEVEILNSQNTKAEDKQDVKTQEQVAVEASAQSKTEEEKKEVRTIGYRKSEDGDCKNIDGTAHVYCVSQRTGKGKFYKYHEMKNKMRSARSVEMTKKYESLLDRLDKFSNK